jgi:hypothetical protein
MVRISSKEASGRGHKSEMRFSDQGEDEIVNDGHVMSRRMFFEVGLVFVQGDIPRIMQAIFNVPVGTQQV